MSFQWVRMNLGVAIFPFATELWGRSIIIPQFDQNFDRVSEQNVPNKDRGIPQAFYMHNVIPTGQGYQSIGYDNRLAAFAPAVTDFDTCFALAYTAPSNAKLLFSPASGKNYIYDGSVGAWASISPFAPGVIGSNTLVTVAEVSGVTYIFYEGLGCYRYDTATKTLIPVVLTGLVAASIKGIVSANGYLIAFSDTDVAWSSTSNPTDFVPSLITGAGGGSVQFTNGIINFCLTISGGFMLYCEQNTVSATYTGNVRFPYIFADVVASGGCDSPEKVSWQSNLSVHYAYTTSGVQELSKAAASGLYPEVTDFLAQQLFEDFNETTLAITVEYLASQLNVKVTAVGDRYIVFSYGRDVDAPDYTHAIVYDASLKRWGKFKVTHRKCFEWQTPNAYGDITYDELAAFSYDDLAFTTYDGLAIGIDIPERPKKDLAFLQGDGKVVTVNFNYGGATANGVLMLGKFQFQRNKWIEHQISDIENVRLGNAFRFVLFPTLDGKTFTTPYEMVARNLIVNAPLMKRYAHWLPAQNLTACFIGAFNLTSYQMNFTLGGDS